MAIANRSDVIQHFVSGVTENKLYWSGLGYPNSFDGNEYSTIAYAFSQDYATLAIDRIGVGQTTPCPDPTVQEQANLEEAINHEIVTMLKAGTTVPGKSSAFVYLRDREATCRIVFSRLTQQQVQSLIG